MNEEIVYENHVSNTTEFYNSFCYSIVRSDKESDYSIIQRWTTKSFGVYGNRWASIDYQKYIHWFFKNEEDLINFLLTWGE